jgi:hypothetical protein
MDPAYWWLGNFPLSVSYVGRFWTDIRKRSNVL